MSLSYQEFNIKVAGKITCRYHSKKEQTRPLVQPLIGEYWDHQCHFYYDMDGNRVIDDMSVMTDEEKVLLVLKYGAPLLSKS